MTPAIMAKVAKPAKLHQIIDLELWAVVDFIRLDRGKHDWLVEIGHLGSAKTQA